MKNRKHATLVMHVLPGPGVLCANYGEHLHTMPHCGSGVWYMISNSGKLPTRYEANKSKKTPLFARVQYKRPRISRVASLEDFGRERNSEPFWLGHHPY